MWQKEKVSRQSSVREIHGMYRMARSGSQNITKDQEQKNIFSSNPNICVTIWNFLFCTISNQNSVLSIVVVVSIWFCSFWVKTHVFCTLHISRNYREFINIFREGFVCVYFSASYSGSERVKEFRRHMWQSFTGKITAKVVLIMNQAWTSGSG